MLGIKSWTSTSGVHVHDDDEDFREDPRRPRNEKASEASKLLLPKVRLGAQDEDDLGSVSDQLEQPERNTF